MYTRNPNSYRRFDLGYTPFVSRVAQEGLVKTVRIVAAIPLQPME